MVWLVGFIVTYAASTSAELEHDSPQVSVSRVVDEVPEVVQIVVDCLFAMKIGHHLQYINGGSFRIKGHEVLPKLFLKVRPIEESKMTIPGVHFILKLPGSPMASMSILYIGHCPDDFGNIVIKGLQAQTDVHSAGH